MVYIVFRYRYIKILFLSPYVKGLKKRGVVKIVRIKKNRRILVELPGFLAVTTNYVKPEVIKLT